MSGSHHIRNGELYGFTFGKDGTPEKLLIRLAGSAKTTKSRPKTPNPTSSNAHAAQSLPITAKKLRPKKQKKHKKSGNVSQNEIHQNNPAAIEETSTFPFDDTTKIYRKLADKYVVPSNLPIREYPSTPPRKPVSRNDRDSSPNNISSRDDTIGAKCIRCNNILNIMQERMEFYRGQEKEMQALKNTIQCMKDNFWKVLDSIAFDLEGSSGSGEGNAEEEVKALSDELAGLDKDCGDIYLEIKLKLKERNDELKRYQQIASTLLKWNESIPKGVLSDKKENSLLATSFTTAGGTELPNEESSMKLSDSKAQNGTAEKPKSVKLDNVKDSKASLEQEQKPRKLQQRASLPATSRQTPELKREDLNTPRKNEKENIESKGEVLKSVEKFREPSKTEERMQLSQLVEKVKELDAKCLRKDDLIKTQKSALNDQAKERAELLTRIKRLEERELALTQELKDCQKKFEASSSQPQGSRSNLAEGTVGSHHQLRKDSFDDCVTAKGDNNSMVLESNDQPSITGVENTTVSHENLPPPRSSIFDRPTASSMHKKRSIYDNSTKVPDPTALRGSQRGSIDKSPSAHAFKPSAGKKIGDGRRKTELHSTPQKTRDHKSLSFSIAPGQQKTLFSAEPRSNTPIADEPQPFHSFRHPSTNTEVRSFSPSPSNLTPITEASAEPSRRQSKTSKTTNKEPRKSPDQRNSIKMEDSQSRHLSPSQDRQNSPSIPDNSEENEYRKPKKQTEQGTTKSPELGANSSQSELKNGATEISLLEPRLSADLSSKKRAPFKISYNVAQLENGEELAFIDSGPANAKYAVVAIHGEITTSAIFIDLMARIRTNIRVVAIDLRGYGKSTYNKSFFSLNDLAEDIAEVIEMLGLARISLMGYSLGGGVCLTFAALYPELVEKVILLNSIGLRGLGTSQKPKPFDQLQKDEDVMALKARIKANDTSYFLERFSKYSKIMPPAVYSAFCKEIASHRALQDTLFVLGTANLNEILGEIKCNILVIHGKENAFCTVDVAREIAKALGYRAKLDIWEECDQNILAFDPKRLERTILEFLFDEDSETLTE